jgi:hypothetical protein
MSPSEARILVTVPEGWTAAPVAPPDLSQTPEVRVLGWQAWNAPDEASHFVAACFDRDTRAWTEEAEPIVLERLRATVSSTALRIARVGGVRVRSIEHAGGLTSEWLDGTGDAGTELTARTFLGFVDTGEVAARRLVACFALCASDRHACQASVDGASVDGTFVRAPPPTPTVRALVTMAHHPSATLGSLAILSSLLGILAVVTRKRPRTK